MADYEEFDREEDISERPPDPRQISAREALIQFFEEHREQVFFSRQLEVRYEQDYFHWITNRALRDLEDLGLVRSEWRTLRSGGRVRLLWHRSYRFYRRSANRVISLVEEYADPNIGASLGLQGEMLVLEGFARLAFVMRGRDVQAYGGRQWQESGHDLDYLFERDGIMYGVEVKNTLGYMDYDEFQTKIRLCQFLGVRPVFAVRMLPRTWIRELIAAGGFALVLRYQLYPWAHRELARRVARELGLPVDAPRSLADGTMARFLRWHEGQG